MDKNIVGHKVVLEPIDESDIEKIREWSRDSLVCKNYHNCNSLEESYLREIIKSPSKDSNLYVINTVDNVTIGKLAIETSSDGNANVDILIGDKVYVGKGYGKDVLRSVINHCFMNLNLDSVGLVFKEDNIRAEHCCYSCGLREDKYYLPEENALDTKRMVLFKKDYIGY